MKRTPLQTWLTVRILVVCFFFLVFFSTIIARVLQLQIFEKDKLTQLIEKQYLKYVKISPKRGAIYDREMRELAVSIDVDSVYARPGEIKNKHEFAQKISPLLGMGVPDLERKLAADRPFVWLQRRIPPSQAARIKKLNLEGIGFIEESKRFYPNRELASHCVGFAGLDHKGLEGIELEYNTYLEGTPGYILVERDAFGRSIYTYPLKQIDAVKGYNLQLTLDKNIQFSLEKALEKGVKKHQASAGVAIAMVPRTGEILALAVYPTFNPNNFWDYSPDQWRNRAVTDAFEPGSTFKIFLIASALNEGVFQPHDLFFCENGIYPIGNRTIHDVHKYGWLSLSDIVKYSSNIGACKIAENLGKEPFYRHIKNFGFGSKTGIDLPGETSGVVPPSNKWSRLHLSTISFGQGISLSPIQLITALSAIANGGTLMKPYLVKSIFDEQGNVVKAFSPESKGNVITPQAARQVTSILQTVVEKGGTGENASLPGFAIAGKTGTAQKVDPTTRQYSPNKMVSSFIGFFPANAPQIALLIMVDEPKGIRYGGVVAAPIFKEVALHLIRYLHIPLQQDNITMVRFSSPQHPSPQPVQARLNYLNPVSFEEQHPTEIMPDFSGLAIRDVLKKAEELNLNIEIEGSGKAVYQYPPPASAINDERRCWVHFQPYS